MRNLLTILALIAISPACKGKGTDVLVSCQHEKTLRKELTRFMSIDYIAADKNNFSITKQKEFLRQITQEKIISRLATRESAFSAEKMRRLREIARAYALKEQFRQSFLEQQAKTKIDFYLVQYLFVRGRSNSAEKRADAHLRVLSRQQDKDAINSYIAAKTEKLESKLFAGKIPPYPYIKGSGNRFNFLFESLKEEGENVWLKTFDDTDYYLVRLLKKQSFLPGDTDGIKGLHFDYLNEAQRTVRKMVQTIPALATSHPEMKEQHKQILELNPAIASRGSATIDFVAFKFDILRQGLFDKLSDSKIILKRRVRIKDIDLVISKKKLPTKVGRVLAFLKYNPVAQLDDAANSQLQTAQLELLMAQEARKAGLEKEGSYQTLLSLEENRILSRAYLEKKMVVSRAAINAPSEFLRDKKRLEFIQAATEEHWKAHQCELSGKI